MKKLLAPLAAAALLIAGCGVGPDKSREDAGDVTHTCAEGAQRSADPGCVDKTTPSVIAFNNHYPNVETKCDGYGHRIFATTHDSAKGRNFIVLPDPTCPGFVAGSEPAVVTGGN